MGLKLISKDLGEKKFYQMMGRVSEIDGKIGILDETEKKKSKKNNSKNVATNYEIAVYNHKTRPFISQPFDENREKFLMAIKSATKKFVMTGDSSNFEKACLWLRGKIVLSIAKRIYKPNALSTIKAKGSSTPLVDTGQLVGSIKSEVEIK